MLQVVSLSKYFGGTAAIEDLSFSISKGKVHAIIGPNGAGKTTLFNLITGLYSPTSGDVLLDGRSMNGVPTHERARRGISRTFQNLQVCMDMTAIENVMLGAHLRMPGGIVRAMLQGRALRRAERQFFDEAHGLLRFVGIEAYAERSASALPYGVLKRLEIARALAAQPKLLFLDEPAAGLNPVETQQIGELVHQIDANGTTVVLVEHDMKLVMSVSRHIVVLNYGRKLAEGTAAEVRANPAVISAYLGSAKVAA